jgi:hypothetical protein
VLVTLSRPLLFDEGTSFIVGVRISARGIFVKQRGENIFESCADAMLFDACRAVV